MGWGGLAITDAIGEYYAPDTAIREICKEFKRLMLSYKVVLDNALSKP